MVTVLDPKDMSTSKHAHRRAESEGPVGLNRLCSLPGPSAAVQKKKSFCSSLYVSLARPQSTALECAKTPDAQACRFKVPDL